MEFQRRGAKWLNALHPVVVRENEMGRGGGGSEGTGGCEVWRRSDKYGRPRLWMALNVY